MSLEIEDFRILKKITQNKKSSDLDKNSKRNQSLKLGEIFVSKND